MSGGEIFGMEGIWWNVHHGAGTQDAWAHGRCMQKLVSAAARAFLLEHTIMAGIMAFFRQRERGLIGKWNRRRRVNNSTAINCKSAWLWCSLVNVSEAKTMPIYGRRYISYSPGLLENSHLKSTGCHIWLLHFSDMYCVSVNTWLVLDLRRPCLIQ